MFGREYSFLHNLYEINFIHFYIFHNNSVRTEIPLEIGDYEIQAKARNADGWSAINSDTHKLHLEQGKCLL